METNLPPQHFSVNYSEMTNRGRLLNLTIIFIVMISGLMGKLAMANNSTIRLQEMVQGLPETIGEWSKSSESGMYDAENLYSYINGGAELYISYQFLSLISQSYLNDEDDEIKIDIFDMESSQNAYGVFTHSRESIDAFVGTNIESEYAAGLLTFWKGSYYISILAYPETESRKLVVQQLAKTIAAQIKEKSEKPNILELLPKHALQPYSIRYFKHFTWLNTYHFFSNENLLNIDSKTEGVTAKYLVAPSNHAVLILLQYPNEAAATTAHQTFKNRFMAQAEDDYAKGADQLWTGCIQNQNIVVIVVDAPTQETAQNLLTSIE